MNKKICQKKRCKSILGNEVKHILENLSKIMSENNPKRSRKRLKPTIGFKYFVTKPVSEIVNKIFYARPGGELT